MQVKSSLLRKLIALDKPSVRFRACKFALRFANHTLVFGMPEVPSALCMGKYSNIGSHYSVTFYFAHVLR